MICIKMKKQKGMQQTIHKMHGLIKSRSCDFYEGKLNKKRPYTADTAQYFLLFENKLLLNRLT